MLHITVTKSTRLRLFRLIPFVVCLENVLHSQGEKVPECLKFPAIDDTRMAKMNEQSSYLSYYIFPVGGRKAIINKRELSSLDPWQSQ